jgi:DNA ligase-1
VGVAQLLVVRALAQVSGAEPAAIAHRLMGDWSPTPEFYRALVAREAPEADVSRPYPFCLAHALDGPPEALGDLAGWQAEWKWDGIRAQLVRRAGRAFLWTRGEELVTDRYPEVAPIADALPEGTVIDGELMPWKDGPLSFAMLQRRIGRKALTRAILAEVPVALVAFDLLEDGGVDVRDRPLSWRRSRLGELVAEVGYPERFFLSPLVRGTTWGEVVAFQAASRQYGAEGLMLKRLSSPYRVGRQRGDWWKWKVSPFTIDAVLTAAQRGAGKRASLYTDYTFSVWDGPRLVPIAKAYSGLTDAEIRRVDAFIRRNMVEAFGPVRTVKPHLVFELAFEGIQRSPRHKSGVALRFPRIARWREDKPPEEADTIETVRGLLPDDVR